MAKKFIRNGIVKMDWEADKFIEDEVGGFCGAIQEYQGTPLLFSDRGCFLVMGSNNGLATVEEIESILRQIYDSGNELTLRDDFCEETMELTGEDFHVTPEAKEYCGLSDEDCADIYNRVIDILQYYTSELVDDPNDAF